MSGEQLDLIEVAVARSLLDQLLEDSRLYRSGADYRQLLNFVVRLRNFAPFNALLLQIQKPGLMYAASARDWRERFDRKVLDEARPLLILWPFGPVALVYDVVDTCGPALPEDVSPFVAQGVFDAIRLLNFESMLSKKQIRWVHLDAGDGKAGSIRCLKRAEKNDQASLYEMRINAKHEPAVKFATLAHELAHLCLGHLGKDANLSVPERLGLPLDQKELEAESVAYIVCYRNGIKPKSERYLSRYVEKNTSADNLDLYQIMRAAGQVETLLGLGAQTKYDKPKGGIRR
jgi:hypothetical protein